jgi:uncharacterized RDD family membrane protein YckC
MILTSYLAISTKSICRPFRIALLRFHRTENEGRKMSYTDTPRPLPGEGSNDGPYRYASFQHRLGAYVLDATLVVLTLGIGWLIWSLIVWGEGQTPAKKILKIRVKHFDTGMVATWGHMGVREFLIPLTVLIASNLTSGVAGLAWIIIEIVFYFTKNNRTLRDHWVKTAVVNEA